MLCPRLRKPRDCYPNTHSQPNSLKQMQALSPTLPSRPGKCPSHLASGKRWGFWLGFVLIGVASLVLTGPALSLLSQSKA